MKTSTWRVFGCVAMVLCACGLVRADDHENECNPRTLSGTYVFTASGFNITDGVVQPKAIVEVIDFHGDGTLSVPAATRSVNGMIGHTVGGSGNYTVENDCTGTIMFDRPTFDIFISPDGGVIWLIQTATNQPNQTAVFQGKAVRRSQEHDRR